MDPELVVIVAAVAVVGLVALSVSAVDQPVSRSRRVDQAHDPSPFEGALDVVDRSVGMYVVRRLTGRPTARASDLVGPGTALGADEVARRIGVSDAPEPPEAPEAVSATAVPPAATGAAAIAAAARAAAEGHRRSREAAAPAVVPIGSAAASARTAPVAARPAAASPPRERLIRDSGIVLIALTIVGLVAVFVLQQR